MAEEAAILHGLRQLRDVICATGWRTSDGAQRGPDQVWIDAGYRAKKSVYPFIRESDQDCYRPILGCGILDGVQTPKYHRPAKAGGTVKFIGEDYHLDWIPEEGLLRVSIDANVWKTFLSNRITCAIDQAGAMVLYNDVPGAHETFADHYTAEEYRSEFLEGKGEAGHWERVRRNNHLWDCGYIACTAAHLCGVRLLEEDRVATAAAPAAPQEQAVGNGFWQSYR
jgi:hypothetical protein